MTSIRESLSGFNGFVSELQAGVCGWVTRQIEQQLAGEVDAWLHRSSHERRAGVGQRQSGAACGRCGSQQAKDFSRNGHRRRQLVTNYGVLTFWLPRVVCQCGGSVHIPFSLLQPYQRFWDDLLEQVERWAQLGLSLRQMQGEIGDRMQTQVGLRKLNAVVQNVKLPTPIALRSVPPVILLDAIWVTLLKPTETGQRDKAGRQRVTKAGGKVCILVALGLYPQSQRWGILGWTLADSESQAAWEQLLLPLEERGLYRERGVELFIHDGDKGLIAALKLLYPHIPHQRCLFHKLRNLWHAIVPPKHLTGTETLQFKRDLIQQATAIFYAATIDEACQLRDAFGNQWQASQPALVETIHRDWYQSIAFHHVLTRFPDWPRHTLRTTSLLERVNRMLRRLFRAASAFHSTAGLLAVVARVLNPCRLI